jgi:hypothetical protein
MFLAELSLGLLIIAAPIILVADGPVIQSVVTAVASVSVAFVAVGLRPGAAAFLTAILRSTAVVIAAPAFWMLVQLLPLESGRVVHSIWESASTALGHPIAGSISIDVGATLLSLARYLSAMAIGLVAAAVAINRRTAEWLLFALTAATTLIALVALMASFSDLKFFSYSDGSSWENAAISCAGIGVILAAGATLHTYEHLKMRPQNQAGLVAWLRPTFLSCLLAILTCSLAIFVGATTEAYFAVIGGMVTLAVTGGIRRFGFGRWGISAIVSLLLFFAAAVITIHPIRNIAGLPLALAMHASKPAVEVTERILADTSLVGTGAGTFAAVMPIYRDIDELMVGSTAPTAAAAIAVEMGPPFLWAAFISAIALVVILLRGALRRQRDSIYPTVGASCIVVIISQAFSNTALFSSPVTILTAAIIGIAIAQSKSHWKARSEVLS